MFKMMCTRDHILFSFFYVIFSMYLFLNFYYFFFISTQPPSQAHTSVNIEKNSSITKTTLLDEFNNKPTSTNT